MKTVAFSLLIVIAIAANAAAETLPTDEAGAIEYLTAKKVRITQDADGHATRVFVGGTPPLTVEEHQLIGLLPHVEQVAINASPCKAGDWGFLQKLPKLNRLAIWHGKHFANLEPFNGLPVESITIGGCMGLRDLNKENPDQLRNAITSLRKLPNLKKANLYHSPLAPDDSHFAHLVENFPHLEELKIDVHAPRGSETTITPAGLAVMQKLPLKLLSLESVGEFTPAHFEAVAKIESLEVLLVDARRSETPTAGIAAFRKARPDVRVGVAEKGAERGPTAPKE